MWTMLDMISLLVLGGTLTAPLAYALATLQGLRHKTVYPLLRIRERDGNTISLVVEQTCERNLDTQNDVDRRCIRLPA